MLDALLQVENLTVRYCPDDSPEVAALDGVSFAIAPGEVVGLLGESGCGKTTLALSLLGLLPPTARVTSGLIRFRGQEIMALNERQLEKVRGAGISMVFQEPGIALHPMLAVGEQVADVVRAHKGCSRRRSREEAERMLEQVHLEDVARIYAAYPHQLSGGQRQRVAIAQALACRPELVIADEPTASLDSCVQEEILALLQELREQFGIAMLLISHNPATLARLADRVMIMCVGQIVDQGRLDRFFAHPDRPQTRRLVDRVSAAAQGRQRLRYVSDTLDTPAPDNVADSSPSGLDLCEPDGAREAPVCTSEAPLETDEPFRTASGGAASFNQFSQGFPPPGPGLVSRRARRPETALHIRALSKTYVQRRTFSQKTITVNALSHIELTVRAGSTLGLIGESGSGKSTLARCMALLERPDCGEIWLEDKDLLHLGTAELRCARRRIQLIFQDPARALNPRLSALELVTEPLEILRWGTRAGRRRRALDLMEEVGLSCQWENRLALEFSGGQRKRLAIARALALEPRILVLDEALSALDLPLRVQIVNLLLDLQVARGLSYVLISHDLSLVGRLADIVVVMHQGRIVEQGAVQDLFTAPQHPATQALLDSTPMIQVNAYPRVAPVPHAGRARADPACGVGVTAAGGDRGY